ncbi:T9SS type A sorting domain-containing protein [Flavobacterium cerinum]|uniref:T9SS type A sorting domain-containing protein n=1 Tax=Flavobacterium cerinum TaxID=2502784 RepID=A0A444HAR0_9FLAO|nr:T9SS type A sorting domain-containing protein [Flavobacterium cerinum]RWX00332.1 T9SS type A sorting domain-containing protein [Flavobacterium cerinum]
MKRIFTIGLLLFLLTFSSKLCAQFTETDIKFWVGEGTSTAVLVVDFRDGSSDPSFAWGYRYNEGTGLTFKDMLEAMAAVEPKFIIKLSNIGFLEDITYNNHAGLAGHPDWWSTWSGDNLQEMYMNSGVSEELLNGRWYGVSYGFMPETVAPTVTYPAYSSTWFNAENVTYWIGDGQNKSVIIIDFNAEGTEPVTYAWGIKYNGVITAATALALIDEADTNLNITITNNEITSIVYKDLTGVEADGNLWNTFKGTNMSNWVINNNISTELTNNKWFGATFGTASARRPFTPIPATEIVNGLTENNKIAFTVYPNPVASFLNIKSDDAVQKSEVLNITGQTVLTVLNSNSIDLSNINTGIYLVKVYTENGMATQKIIKQ